MLQIKRRQTKNMISYILRLRMVQINKNIISQWVVEYLRVNLDLKLEGLECQKEEPEWYSLGNENIKIVIKAGEW